MPEGDTIRWAAKRIRPVLEGRVPEEILAPQQRHGRDRWPERLAGRGVTSVDTYGKHLFIRFGPRDIQSRHDPADRMSSGCFEGGLALHSHLRMTGSWSVYRAGQRWRRSSQRAWIVLRAAGHEVVEFDGPMLELLTDGRTRFDRRLASLGPDVLADEFDAQRFLARLRDDDPTRGIGDALLDQSIVAGIGNMWKAEGCWEAQLDPWRPVADLNDEQALAIVELIRPRMLYSAEHGPLGVTAQVHNRAGRPCARCRTLIRARGQGDDNRTTFWCPGCQE